jgi:hypothetical protein
MEYFVSPDGNDLNAGTSDSVPFATIGRGLQGAALGGRLQPGDVLTLRGGTYVEEVSITNLAGKPGQEISIRSHAGERAVIDSSIPVFRTAAASPTTWVPATTIDPSAHPDEWARPLPSPTACCRCAGRSSTSRTAA